MFKRLHTFTVRRWTLNGHAAMISVMARGIILSLRIMQMKLTAKKRPQKQRLTRAGSAQLLGLLRPKRRNLRVASWLRAKSGNTLN
jgi:hypothetical protein